jgi:biotin-dependent carboxylase-like uncharacterized protein
VVTRAVEVVRPGLLLTVQDLGRPALGRFGISAAGAMDPLALRIANRLVGNEAGAAALEITGPGTELLFHGEARLAIGGADLGATVDGAAVEPWQVAHARDGAVLRLGVRRGGARAVVAIAGGLAVPLVLGSASADLDAGLGGGRLSRGSRLPLGEARSAPASPPYPAALAAVLAAYADPLHLRFVAGEDPAVSAETAALFAHTPWKVSDRSNRTGYRLSGPVLPVGEAAERLSEPLAPGTLQLPPDGQPILLMADRQTIGGYPCLGHLIAADRPRAAQLWPGDQARFLPVSLEAAQRAARDQAAALAAL